MTKTHTDWQVWQDVQVAGNFTDRRRGGVLGAAVQLDTMLRLLKCVDASPLTVLDLGCGDGILLETITTALPVERGVLLDGSSAMLGKAQERFAKLGSFGNSLDFVEADFNTPAWQGALSCRAFDAVVSGFAIHHSKDDRKCTLYAEIYGLLKPGGVFINIEHVSSISPLGEELFEAAYAENLERFRRSRGEEVSVEEVYEELRNRPDKAANRLAPLETQLQWLREIGFTDVDCYWKHFELAVLAGFKQA